MKCSKCGNEYEGNFCPQCGKPANVEENSVARNANTYVAGIAGIIVDVILTILLLRYKVNVILIG